MLLPPTIVMPVSPLYGAVGVENPFPGATVTVYADGVAVGSAVCGGGRGWVALYAGVRLAANQKVTAAQAYNGETSAQTPDGSAAVVTGVPGSLPPVSVATHLYAGATCVGVAGVFPVATVHVSLGGAEIGKGDGLVDLNGAVVGVGQVLSVEQRADGPYAGEVAASGATVSAPAERYGHGHEVALPAVTFPTPAAACDTAIYVGNVVPGAQVVVTINGAATSGDATGSAWYGLPSGLKETDLVSARQWFPSIAGSASAEASLGGILAAGALAAPVVGSPLFEMSAGVVVTGLRPGATVSFWLSDAQNADENVVSLGSAYSASGDPQTMVVPGLKRGKYLRAKQAHCGVESPASVGVRIEAFVYTPQLPRVEGPLYVGATFVHVRGIAPGLPFRLISGRYGPLTGAVQVWNYAHDVVVPGLTRHDKIYVEIPSFNAGIGAYLSEATVVEELNDVAAPGITPPLDHLCRWVEMKRLTAGARVEVYRNGAYARSENVWAETQQVFVGGTNAGDVIGARQVMGGRVTGVSAAPPAAGAADWEQVVPAAVKGAIVWHPLQGPAVAYANWDGGQKQSLRNKIDAIRAGQALNLGVPVGAVLDTAGAEVVAVNLTPAAAWEYYTAYVAQTIVTEMERRVGWGVAALTPRGMGLLLDGTSLFSSRGNYHTVELRRHGFCSPGDPGVEAEFLRKNRLVRETEVQTLFDVLDWCRVTLSHMTGGWSEAENLGRWGYVGFPTVELVSTLHADPGSLGTEAYWTGGCWGTTGFLRMALRTVNMPVELVVGSNHALPYFVSLELGLTHGDDPYSSLVKGIPAIPIGELPVSGARFQQLFGPGVTRKNVGLRGLELAKTYLPFYLLRAYCHDKASGASHGQGEVYGDTGFADHWTVTELETIDDLWNRLEERLGQIGGCGQVPGR